MAHHHAVDLAFEPRRGAVAPPVVARRELLELGERHRVVGLHRVTVLDPGPLHARERGLQREDVLRARRGLRIAHHAQHRLHVDVIARAHLGELRVIVLQVVVAVGHAQAALAEVDDVPGRILRVLVHVQVIGHGNPDPLVMRDQGRKLRLVANGVDPRELRGERLQPERLEPRLVHEARVEVGHAARLRVGGRLAALDDGAQLVERLLDDLDPRAVLCLVGRNLGRIEPASVDVAIQVVLRTHGGIHVLQNDARSARGNAAPGGGCVDPGLRRAGREERGRERGPET